MNEDRSELSKEGEVAEVKKDLLQEKDSTLYNKDKKDQPKHQKTKSVTIQDPPVSNLNGYSIVKIEEKHGVFHNAVPVMPLPIAVVLCILNIGVPGVGTLLSAPLSFCCPSRLSNKLKAFVVNLGAAFIQIATFLLIVGWIWSILWGMTMVQLSLASARKAKNTNVPYYVRRQSSLE